MSDVVYLLLGSNIGDREKNLEQTIEKISAIEGLEIVATSAIYLTDPVGVKDEQPSFLNQAIKAEYQFRPLELLHALEKVESDLGRTDKGDLRPRTIDCDILLFGNLTMDDHGLTIPHPRLLERPFAMIPLLDIEPDLKHPVSKKKIASYIKSRTESGVMLYKDHVARTV